MLVHHRGRVASLLRGQILVSVRGKVIGAKTVSQSVGLARDSRLLAKLNEMLLPGDFVQVTQLAFLEGSERLKPCGQCRNNLDQPALAGLGFAGGYLNMVLDAL